MTEFIKRYLEDFEAGQTFRSGRIGIDGERIKSFAVEFDPGDELRVESEVLEVLASESRLDQGVIKVRTTTLNQDNQPVQVSVGNLIVPRRPARAS